MRYSSQAVLGLLAVLSIASVQTLDMGHGGRHLYSNAVNDIITDDGLIFDTRTSAALGVDVTATAHNALNAA